MFATPAPLILPTSKGSPDYNQRHHPYSGLLSSMHTWGIYNGRYGFTTAGRLNRISPDDKPAVDAMLAVELARQDALKTELGKSPETAARVEQAFTHVPLSSTADTTITIKPRGDGVYALTPFPLASDGAAFAYAYRNITPHQHERDRGWAKILRNTPTEWETLRLVPG